MFLAKHGSSAFSTRGLVFQLPLQLMDELPWQSFLISDLLVDDQTYMFQFLSTIPKYPYLHCDGMRYRRLH
jgi:hypothetical protein